MKAFCRLKMMFYVFFITTFTVIKCVESYLYCYMEMTYLQPDYYETRPNLITAGLRLVATSEITADLTLVVQHKKVTPFEVTIENIKARKDAPYYAIRLFLKPKKRMFVAYESKAGETILAEYCLEKSGLVNAVNHNAGKYIDTWRITDSEEGFYDAVTCRLLATRDPILPCPCKGRENEMCIYDYIRKTYEKVKLDWDDFQFAFNVYNCLFFHERKDQMYEILLGGGRRHLTSTSFITEKKNYPVDMESGICLDGTENTHQLQFYDLKWDLPGKLPKIEYCTSFHVRQMAQMMDETIVIEDEEPKPISTLHNIGSYSDERANKSHECWSPTWTVTTFCLDGVLFIFVVLVFLAAVIGKNRRRH